eukprot:11099992-Lingulodinium_polyedra.AAC.1
MLLRENAWQVDETAAEGRVIVSTGLLKSELAVWYGTPAGRLQTRINDLSYTIFGTHSRLA